MNAQAQARLELQDFLHTDLFARILNNSDEEFQAWLVSMGLLHASRQCHLCHNPMTLSTDGRNALSWRCRRRSQHDSQPTIGFKKGTFFEGAHLSYKEVFQLAYYWADEVSIDDATRQTQVNHEHVVDWYSKFRNVCRLYLRRHPIQIGGPGVTVYADETFMTKKHGRRGRHVRRFKKWVFAMVEHGTGIAMCYRVHRRNAATLLPYILRHTNLYR